MDFLMNNEVPRCDGALSGMKHLDAWMAKLEDTADSLHLRYSSIFEIMQQPTSVNTSMQCKYDERRKINTIEFETTTSLNCSLEDASVFLWRDFQSDRVRDISLLVELLLRSIVY